MGPRSRNRAQSNPKSNAHQRPLRMHRINPARRKNVWYPTSTSKIIITTIIFLILLIFTSIIKNQTRIIEKKLYKLNKKKKIDREKELKILYSVLDRFNNNEDRVRDIQRYNEINDKKINMLKNKELNNCVSTKVLNVKLEDQIKNLEAELKLLEEKKINVNKKLSKTKKKVDGQSDVSKAVGLIIITIFGILVFAVLLTYHKSSLNRLEKLYGPRIPSEAASIGPPKFETNVNIKASK